MQNVTKVRGSRKRVFLIALFSVCLTPFLVVALQVQGGKTNLKFQPADLMGSGSIEGGGQFSFDSFKSQDGVFVQRRVENYESVGRAHKRLGVMLHDAIKVIDHGPKRPLQGTKTGERWKVSFRYAGTEKPVFLVFWQDGDAIYILQSNSLVHVQALEDWIYPPAERAK
jgi:hypothetical protein